MAKNNMELDLMPMADMGLALEALGVTPAQYAALDARVQANTDAVGVLDGRVDEAEAGRIVLRNLITNGDFSQGTTSLLLSKAIATVVDGKLKLDFASIPARFGWLCDFKAGEKIYIRISDLQVTNPSKLRNIAVTTGSTIVQFVENLVPNILPNTKYSAVVTPSLDASVLRFNVLNSDVSEDIDLSLDGIMAIKITSIFGAGNEPTKSQFDALLSVLPFDYWEGDYTLTDVDMMNWQLALNRQATQAITALGGTIL